MIQLSLVNADTTIANIRSEAVPPVGAAIAFKNNDIGSVRSYRVDAQIWDFTGNSLIQVFLYVSDTTPKE